MDKDPGRIRIRLSDLDGRIAVVIQDNGQGIPAVALPHIFDRFYRADPSRNAGTGGSGLGLAIAKQIIEEHGGTIEADSKEGEGTSIQFTLRKLADDSRTRSGGDLHEEDSDH
jgi:signal transduction histidine kinase